MTGGYGDVVAVNPDGTGLQDLTPTMHGDWPSFRGNGSELAYVEPSTPSSAAIMAMAPDGSNKHLLFAWHPVSHLRWSPDGARFAYAADESNNVGIPTLHLINADGTNHLKPFANDGSAEWDPEWFGTSRLVFRQQVPNGPATIGIADADGANRATLLTDRNMQTPSLSPDGSKLVFAHWNGSAYVIMVANGDGGSPHVVGPPGTAPAFSPDGTQLVFARHGAAQGIWTMRLDGSGLRQVTAGQDDHPQWGAGTSPPNIPPHALGSATNSKPLAVFANAASSYDEDGTIVQYVWRWGDNTAASPNKYAWHKYAAAGTYLVRVTVTDDDGARTTKSAWVKVA